MKDQTFFVRGNNAGSKNPAGKNIRILPNKFLYAKPLSGSINRRSFKVTKGMNPARA